MLQYFGTSWAEIEAKLPELAEAGYTSMWLPPPAKGSGGLSVGYDHWDPFDLGSIDQRGSVSTLYGTEAELIRLVEKAHQFGIRIYYDNIMNHRAFDIPGFDESTPIDVYPGLYPEDFHLNVTEEGFYRKWGSPDWNDEWQVLHRDFSDLIDLAQENPNQNFGTTMGSTIPKLVLVRQPNNPEYYTDTDLPFITTFDFGGTTFNFYPFANKEPFQDIGCVGCAAEAAGNGRFDWVDTDADGQHDVGETSEPFTDTGIDPLNNQSAAYGYGDTIYNMGNPIPEDMNSYQIRAARWQMNRTCHDGYRLDAVKHVPDYFFGSTTDTPLGYTGGVQLEYNHVHGFSDLFSVGPNDNRNSTYNTEAIRDDAMMFGEHLGFPPPEAPYIQRGMRLVDNQLKQKLNDTFHNPFGTLQGLENPGAGGFSQYDTVMHSQSHDNNPFGPRHLQHAFYFTRSGLALIYTDGYNEALTLQESGGDAFPRHANANFLGQFGDDMIPNLMWIHNQYARGIGQWGRWGDADVMAYERHDDREGGAEQDQVTLLFALNDRTDSDIAFNDNIGDPFPPGKVKPPGAGSDQGLAVGFPPGSVLKLMVRGAPNIGDAAQLVTVKTAFNDTGSVTDPGTQVYVGGQSIPSGGGGIEFVVPRDSYVAYSYIGPETSLSHGGKAGGLDTDIGANYRDDKPNTIEFRQNGERPGSMVVARKDGVDGDPGFNPYGLPDSNTSDFQYDLEIPRLTDDTPFDIYTFVDGSAETVLLRLDAGYDLNHQMGIGETDAAKGYRDHPQGERTDTYAGYEDTGYQGRYGSELFASKNAASNTVGAVGAAQYSYTIGGGASYSSGTQVNDFNGAGRFGANWIYHDPTGSVTIANFATHGSPAQQQVPLNPTAAQTVDLWFKVGNQFTIDRGYVYYTTDGSEPNGAYAFPYGSTMVVACNFIDVDNIDGTVDWWKAVLPTQLNGSEIKYKVSFYHATRGDLAAALSDADGRKRYATSIRCVTNVNPLAITNWYNKKIVSTNGLEEGYHCLWARAFLNRAGKASIYNTHVQPFYMDAYAPGGVIAFPQTNGENLYSSSYGFVVRSDTTVNKARYHIDDNDPNNDDSVTGEENGNGLDTNGVPAWATAFTSRVPLTGLNATYPEYPDEWRFNYRRIPAFDGSTATVKVELCEASSEVDTNRVTILERTVVPNAPSSQIFVRFPSHNEAVTIDASDTYNIQTYFTEGLDWNKDKWTLKINGSSKSADEFSFHADADAGHDRMQYPWSDFREGENTIAVTYTDINFNLQDAITVYFNLVGTSVLIINPPEANGDGEQFVIVKPDVPSPTSVDRSYEIEVETDTSAQSVCIQFAQSNLYAGGAMSGPTTNAGSLVWTLNWTNLVEGTFYFEAQVDNDGVKSTIEATAGRTTPVEFRQTVEANGSDLDDDDDGLLDFDESFPTNLPSSNPETWNNGQVHIWRVFGSTDPLSPDSDNDGLPDGLESGWETAHADTDTAADTNGDGFKNFTVDVDPPRFNTTDNGGLDDYDLDRSRTDIIAGSLTDPIDPDSDNDGILDGIEDWNRNGRVEILDAGMSVIASPSTVYNSSRVDRSRLPAGFKYMETDPNDQDSDDDGDGDGAEDADKNGWIAGDTNSNRVYETSEAWTETDPLKKDTDGDGMLDGFETNCGLDPLDDGVDSMRTAGITNDGDVNNGPSGDPDGDGLPNINDPTPCQSDNIPPPPPGEIFVGDGVLFGSTEDLDHYQNFTDWGIGDCKILDEYNGDGTLAKGDDLYLAYDGWDTSRDIISFYSHDGGADGNYYFRLDFFDLQAFAEEENLNIYIVIDVDQNPDEGEALLPDTIDTLTEMKWDAVVALYDGANGRVYVDVDNVNNTTSHGQDLVNDGGVEVRDFSHPQGFVATHYDSDLDAVEFSISRAALQAAGWLGLPLNLQVFTTKDGTQNDGTGGGDIGGRSDVRDALVNDYIGENENSVDSILYNWFSTDDQCGQSKVAVVFHANQHDQPGSYVQERVNNGFSAGYHRPLEVHDMYGLRSPVNLHLTATLATALEWAEVDEVAFPGDLFRDGEVFNNRIETMVGNDRADLIGTTFSDHILSYFTDTFNQDNVDLADEVMSNIYGQAPGPNVFWNPERVTDGGVLSTISTMGYGYTLIDQMLHLRQWFGREVALGDDGYRINRIHGVNCFVVNDQASSFMFDVSDGGLPHPLRRLVNRKARSGTQDQVITLFRNWEDFSDIDNARAWDRAVRWMANHPWIKLVTLEQIANDEIDITKDGMGDSWFEIDRGSPVLDKLAQDFIHHSSQENYDNWYNGVDHEGLKPKVFEIRPGVSVADAYGQIAESGIVSAAWFAVSGIAESNLQHLARATIHASVFETAFHEEDNNNLSKFSTGDYIYPDQSFDNLIGFAKVAQSQTRFASLYKRVDAWQAGGPSVAPITSMEDVDLDGESEYLLSNDRLFAVFEKTGGRLVALFVREPVQGVVYQVVGNPVSYAGSDTEHLGVDNVLVGTQNVDAHRTSALTDRYTAGSDTNYVNDVYTVAAAGVGTGWMLTSSDGEVAKTVTLGVASSTLEVSYTVGAATGPLYIRHGLSPNLNDLLLNGQQNLSVLSNDGSLLSFGQPKTERIGVRPDWLCGRGSHGRV